MQKQKKIQKNTTNFKKQKKITKRRKKEKKINKENLNNVFFKSKSLKKSLFCPRKTKTFKNIFFTKNKAILHISFPIFGGRDSTRALQSSLIQISRGVVQT